MCHGNFRAICLYPVFFLAIQQRSTPEELWELVLNVWSPDSCRISIQTTTTTYISNVQGTFTDTALSQDVHMWVFRFTSPMRVASNIKIYKFASCTWARSCKKILCLCFWGIIGNAQLESEGEIKRGSRVRLYTTISVSKWFMQMKEKKEKTKECSERTCGSAVGCWGLVAKYRNDAKWDSEACGRSDRQTQWAALNCLSCRRRQADEWDQARVSVDDNIHGWHCEL